MEGKQFHIRTLVVAGLLAVLLLVFAGALYNLQVLHWEEYRAASTVKIANVETVEAARGEIVDRYGRSLVGNRATYEITLNTSIMGKEAERTAKLAAYLVSGADGGVTTLKSAFFGTPPGPISINIFTFARSNKNKRDR